MMQRAYQNCSFLLIFIAVLILITGCVKERDLTQNVVMVHYPTEPTSLHPTNGVSASMYYVFDYTQKTLTRIDHRTLMQTPLLVKGLAEVSEDGLQYTYELRDDVKWDDGSPLTVDDIIFTVKVSKCPVTDNAVRRSTTLNLKDIVKDPLNPRRFTMIAKNVYFKNPHFFDEVFLIQKRHWDPEGVFDQISIPEMDVEPFDSKKYPGLEEWAAGFNAGENGRDPARLTGLGPYEVTEWVAGSTLTLTRKENWWGENDTSMYSANYPEKIIFKFSPDHAATYLALKKQNYDVVTFLSTSYLLKLRDKKHFNDNYLSGFVDQYSYNYIAMNMKPSSNRTPYFTDVRVRRAMAYLTPVDELIQTMTLGRGSRQASFVQSVYKEYYNDALQLIPFDVEKAKKLLTEAGWVDTDGNGIRDKVINGKKVQFSFQFNHPASEDSKEIALMVKDAMYRAGVDLIPNPMDLGSLTNSMGTQEFDMLALAWSSGAYPEDPEQLFHTRNWINHGYNFTGFGNARTDSLIDASNRTLDKQERIKLLKEIQARVYEEQPYIFTYAVQRKVVLHKRFTNLAIYSERPGVVLNYLKLISEPVGLSYRVSPPVN